MATRKAVLLQLNGMLMMWKTHTASNARRCHAGHQNSSRFHPGNQAEVFIRQNLQPAHQDSSLKTEISGTEPAHPLI